MKEQELMEGLPMISPIIGLFDKCILAKMNKQNFEKDKAKRETKPL